MARRGFSRLATAYFALFWRDGRAVECARFEIVLRLIPVRGFESPSLRQTESRLNPRLCYFCIKGVAGIIINTEVYVPQLSDFYLTQKRDEHGFYTK